MYGLVIDCGNAMSFLYAKDKEELVRKLRKAVNQDLETAFSIKVYDLSKAEALEEFCELAEYRPKECRKVVK